MLFTIQCLCEHKGKKKKNLFHETPFPVKGDGVICFGDKFNLSNRS